MSREADFRRSVMFVSSCVHVRNMKRVTERVRLERLFNSNLLRRPIGTCSSPLLDVFCGPSALFLTVSSIKKQDNLCAVHCSSVDPELIASEQHTLSKEAGVPDSRWWQLCFSAPIQSSSLSTVPLSNPRAGSELP
jgi:hypothetical protein